MKVRCFPMVALISFICSSQQVEAVRAEDAPNNAEPGKYKVRTIAQFTLRDSKRMKDLQLRIHHPDGSGPFPLIVWSHGAGGSKDNYSTLMEHWASHGYVTIQPTHSDSRSLASNPRDPVNFRDWQSRPADVSFVLDSLADIEAKEPALKGLIDHKRIGVGGHSFGANTAQMIGGAKTFPMGGEKKSFADSRVTAVMLLSGQGPGEMLTEKSWSDFKTPMFVMSGSADGPTRTGQPAEWRKKPYELSPPGDKYLVWVEGLDHGYGGITGWDFNPRNKRNADHVRYTKVLTTAFWDAHLKDSANARTSLQSDSVPALNGVQLQHK